MRRISYSMACCLLGILPATVQPVSAAGMQVEVIKAANKDRVHRVVGSPQVGYWAVAGYRHQKAPRHVRLEGFADHCPAPARRRFVAWFRKKVARLRATSGSPYGFYLLAVVPASGHLLVTFRDRTLYLYRCEDITEIRLPQVSAVGWIGFLGQTADGALWFRAYRKSAAWADIRRIPWDKPVVIYRVHNGRVQALHLPEAVHSAAAKTGDGPAGALVLSSVCDVGRIARPGDGGRRMLLCIDRRMRIRRYPLAVDISNSSSGVYPLAPGLGVAFDPTSAYDSGHGGKMYQMLGYVCLKKRLSQCGIKAAMVHRKRDESAYRYWLAAPTIAAYNGVVYFVSKRALYALDKNGVHRLLVFPKPVAKRKVGLEFAGPSTVLVTTPDFIYRVKR